MVSLDEYIDSVVAEAPPLDDEKRKFITAIFAQAVEE